MAEIGARTNRVEYALTAATDASLRLTSSLSEIENTDLVKATVDLQLQEVAYQAALGATSRVIVAEPPGLPAMMTPRPGLMASRPVGDTVTVTDTDLPVIELVHPMPGFPDLHKFALVQLDDASELCQPHLARAARPALPRGAARRRSSRTTSPRSATTSSLELGHRVGGRRAACSWSSTPVASLAETTANLAAPMLVNPSPGAPLR